jgi:hypothetical protein
MPNHSLLQNPPQSEYPTEFLVARLQGKKSRLFQNWDKLLSRVNLHEILKDTPLYPHLAEYGNVGAWRHLNHENNWVFIRMNPQLRKLFAPYFILRQTDVLLVAMRYLHKKVPLDEIRLHVENSMLNDGVREVLTAGGEFTDIVRNIEGQLILISRDFKGLLKQYTENGFQGMEIYLKEIFLTHIVSYKTDYYLTSFFKKLIDAHNCLILLKSKHWKQMEIPRFLGGGTFSVSFYEKAFFRKNVQPAMRLFRLTDLHDKQSPLSVMETALLRTLTATIKKWSRLGSASAYILYYLWEQFRYTRNISMLLHTVMLDEDLVAEHIIQ